MINLTLFPATPEEIKARVIDLPPRERQELIKRLKFDTIPTVKELFVACDEITKLAVDSGHSSAMIGGDPALMELLADSLRRSGIKPCYPFRARFSTEVTEPDGTVVEGFQFKYIGWWPV